MLVDTRSLLFNPLVVIGNRGPTAAQNLFAYALDHFHFANRQISSQLAFAGECEPVGFLSEMQTIIDRWKACPNYSRDQINNVVLSLEHILDESGLLWGGYHLTGGQANDHAFEVCVPSGVADQALIFGAKAVNWGGFGIIQDCELQGIPSASLVSKHSIKKDSHLSREWDVDPWQEEKYFLSEYYCQLVAAGIGPFVLAYGMMLGAPLIIMEKIQGRTFNNWMREEFNVAVPKRFLRIVRSLIENVRALHSRNIVHRDLKPTNVMVRSDDTTIIIDYGLSYWAGQLKPERQNIVVGTPHYLAPEHFLRNSSRFVDRSQDIFALGMILLDAVSDRRNFTEEILKHPEDVMMHRFNNVLRDVIESAIGDLQAHGWKPVETDLLGRILGASLQFDPGVRWKKFDELASQVEWLED